MAMSTGKVVALIQAMGSSADPAVIEAKVEEWLDAHPEATTTVQDGSITEQKLATSIAQKLGLISSLSDEIDNIGSDVTDLKSAFASESIEKFFDTHFNPDASYNGLWHLYDFPDSGFKTLFGIDVMTDGRNFIPLFDITQHKNTGGQTWYFSPTGNTSNDGLTEQTPKKLLNSSNWANINDGDTLIFLDGIYPRHDYTIINKSVNLIAKNPGNVIFANGAQNYTYTFEDGNTYKTERSTVCGVIYDSPWGYMPLTKKASLAEVKTTPFSFASVSSTLYINLNGTVPTNQNVFVNVQYGSVLSTELYADAGQNLSVYFEGITFMGGTNGGLLVDNKSLTQKNTVYAYKCKFMGACLTTYDAVSLLASLGYFVECEAAFSEKDGFNYHSKNSLDSHGFEWNCKGYGCGVNVSTESSNGSTQHSGYVFRINGVYHDNKGPNIADVYATTKSLNMKCLAFDSTSATGTAKADFMVQGDGATMWCESCKANSGTSDFNFAAVQSTVGGAQTTMYCNRCMIGTKYDSGGYQGTYVITNN